MNVPPLHVLAAVTHPDPYPYYAALPPLAYEPALRLWVAAGEEAVHAALHHPALRVRPAEEPVPRHLEGHPAGRVFASLVRMKDGPEQRALKGAVQGALEGLDPEDVARVSARWAAELAGHVDLDTFAARLPLLVLGELLGVPGEERGDLAGDAADLAACFAPGADGTSLGARGAGAASAWARFEGLAPLGLHAALHAAGAGLPDPLLRANALGFMTQALDATRGLLGNALLALGRHPEALAALRARSEGWRAVVQETARWDPSVQNTRRFAAEDLDLCGCPVRAGDAVLVVLAHAGRRRGAGNGFDPFGPGGEGFAFGIGTHACPGQELALAIASGGLRALLEAGVDPAALPLRSRYHPSLNTRIPCFVETP